MKIKFLGAAGTVTGSKYLLTSCNNHHYLVDCGLFQGGRELRERNWHNLEIDPSEISAVFITHAHIDHTGYLPRLVSTGFKGPIYCTEPTFELSKILLPDSGYLQEEEARYVNHKGYSRHKPALPLYTREQAEESLNFFKVIDFHTQTQLFNELNITFFRAGHILGASSILLEIEGKRIIFSGDVGHYRDLIMNPPDPLPDADYLVIESTYGDRLHEKENLLEKMSKIINRAASNKGTIVIPAFAVGRAQLILHIIHVLKDKKEIPDIQVFLDSPMAIDATELYCHYHDEHRLDAQQSYSMCSIAKLTRTTQESQAINEIDEPKIIISASGMASGGRILHHLKHYISDPKNTVVLVGYQAIGTRGRALQDGVSKIKVFGDDLKVNANIETITSLSAHGDYNELIHWLNESKLKNPKVFITHGETEASKAFSDRIKKVFKWDTKIPKHNEEVVL
ncbi:MAG: MBL fold metallo-hydrolase [Myxococcales bacterium]|nr:MBL fold metallo-hydrolase [Myxococcales bacterium]USN50059.1 MAG: MBL fold metallo-hydrolase [Myxococcales bacterium]